jgi:hypothetical protein
VRQDLLVLRVSKVRQDLLVLRELQERPVSKELRVDRALPGY